MLTAIEKNIPDIAITNQGTHCLQSLIALITTSAEENIVLKSLKGKMVGLSKVNF